MQREAYREVLRRSRLVESLRKAQDRADADVRLFVRSGIVALLAVSSALVAMIWLLMPDI
jgi:hypothetical protein